MREFLHRRILLPAFEGALKCRKTFRYWRDLERSQWLSESEVAEVQLAALQRLLSHAFENCPYYREMWTSLGLGPHAIKNIDDFRRWPVIERETIREHRLEMRSTVTGMRLMAKATGGSSGTPLQFDLDPNSLDRRMAAWHRGYKWAGGAPGTKQFYLWGVPLGEQPRWKRWKDRLYNALYRRLVMNTFDFTPERAPVFLERLNRYRPDVIVAYTNPLYEFARWLDEKALRPFAPRSIIIGAEKLHPFQRELIERVFQAPVFETYGSREFMLIGAECDRHEGLHLTMEHLLVEILDDDGRPTPAGEEGNVVVTDLYNYGMPFIRYANGDRAIAGWIQCSCGRGLPLLKGVVGRQLDILETPDGRRIPGEFFPHLIKDYPAIQRFHVMQDEPDRIRLYLQPRTSWDAVDLRSLEHEVRANIGSQVRFEIVRSDDIPLTAAGKHRVVVNLCREVPTAATAGSQASAALLQP